MTNKWSYHFTMCSSNGLSYDIRSNQSRKEQHNSSYSSAVRESSITARSSMRGHHPRTVPASVLPGRHSRPPPQPGPKSEGPGLKQFPREQWLYQGPGRWIWGREKARAAFRGPRAPLSTRGGMGRRDKASKMVVEAGKPASRRDSQQRLWNGASSLLSRQHRNVIRNTYSFLDNTHGRKLSWPRDCLSAES